MWGERYVQKDNTLGKEVSRTSRIARMIKFDSLRGKFKGVSQTLTEKLH